MAALPCPTDEQLRRQAPSGALAVVAGQGTVYFRDKKRRLVRRIPHDLL